MHFLGWWQLDTAFAENRTHHGSCFLFHLSFILCMQRFWTWAYVFLPFADHGQASCVWWWRFEGQIAQCESRQSEQGDHWELSARTQTCGLVAWILLLFFPNIQVCLSFGSLGANILLDQNWHEMYYLEVTFACLRLEKKVLAQGSLDAYLGSIYDTEDWLWKKLFNGDVQFIQCQVSCA